MPEEYRQSLASNYADANLVFLGFEDNEESGCDYKLYLEFWDKCRKEIQTSKNPAEPVLLHLGFKWNPEASSHREPSRYMWFPSLSIGEILHRVSRIYSGHGEKDTFEISKEIIEAGGRRSGDKSLVYLEVFEANSVRKSFDINIYRANLRMRDIHSSLSTCWQHFSIPPQQFTRLYGVVADKYFGHLSGGVKP